jgi:hypothetical protein
VELLQEFSETGPASINTYKKTKYPVQLGPLDWATKEVLDSPYILPSQICGREANGKWGKWLREVAEEKQVVTSMLSLLIACSPVLTRLPL